MLGTGLASIVRVIRSKGFQPHYTLVENDKTVLKWALELLEHETAQKTEPVCNDAKAFMEQNTKKYDLVFIDIFNGRVVPEFVTTAHFLGLCRNSLSSGGRIAFNYIVNSDSDWEKVKKMFTDMFPGGYVKNKDINRILITASKP